MTAHVLIAAGSGSREISRRTNAQLIVLEAKARECQAQGWGVAQLRLSLVDYEHRKLSASLLEHYFEVTYYPPESKGDRRMYDIVDSWGFVLGTTWPYRFTRVQRDSYGFVRTDFRTEIEARDWLRMYHRDFEKAEASS